LIQDLYSNIIRTLSSPRHDTSLQRVEPKVTPASYLFLNIYIVPLYRLTQPRLH